MSEWIKVGDRLPKNQDMVLACLRNGDIYAGKYYGVFAEEVTHWQPLPEPPKRESSFEAWWAQHFHAQGWHDSTKLARFVWDAAIAASKSPDFVP